MGSAKQDSQYPFRMLGPPGKGLVRKKIMCPGCVCGIGASCPMGRCRKAAGNSLAAGSQSLHKAGEGAQSRKKSLARATPGRRGVKIGLLATRS